MKFRYQALQQQLSPHFLFNSLNTLVSEMQYDVNSAMLFTGKLSEVYRYILECQECRTIKLEEELNFIDNYIYLQNVRLGDCISVEKNIGCDYTAVSLPPLTLQLLVENIIKHNVVSRNHPITISVYSEDNNRLLCIKNPVRQTKKVISSKKGLKNLAMRYELLSQQQIQIISNPDYFTVKVPLLYE